MEIRYALVLYVNLFHDITCLGEKWTNTHTSVYLFVSRARQYKSVLTFIIFWLNGIVTV